MTASAEPIQYSETGGGSAGSSGRDPARATTVGEADYGLFRALDEDRGIRGKRNAIPERFRTAFRGDLEQDSGMKANTGPAMKPNRFRPIRELRPALPE